MSNEMMRIGNENETMVLSSREVAEMIEKDHAKLMRDIRTYIGYLAETNLGLGDFFTESSYVDNNSQTRPCYNITKKGCEFIAHKMTGQKGAIFTAIYIDRFHLMEESLKQVIPMLTNEQKLQLAIFNASNKEETIIASAELDRYRQSQIKEKEQENRLLLQDNEHKDNVINTFVEEVDIATMRRRISDIVRFKTADGGHISQRWVLLYDEYGKANQINLNLRYKRAIESGIIKKSKTKLDYVEFILNDIEGLYSLCVKLFESDVEKLQEEWFGTVSRVKEVIF